MQGPPRNPPSPERPVATPDGDAIQRWVAALNARGAPELVALAVAPEAQIERQGIGARRDEVVEIIDGVDNIGRWMALSPEGTTFAAGPTHEAADGGLRTVRYTIEVAGFHNGGAWVFRLGAEGKIAWLRHQPDSLADPSVGEVRDPAESWRRYVREIPVHNHGGHDHAHHGHDHAHDHEDHSD